MVLSSSMAKADVLRNFLGLLGDIFLKLHAIEISIFCKFALDENNKWTP